MMPFRHLPALLSLATLLAFSTSASAALIVPDTKIGEAKMANSGDAQELALLRAFSGEASLTLYSKLDVDAGDAGSAVQSASGIWMLTDLKAPGYYALKFGIGGTTATADTFFFRNTGDLTQLVWANEQVQYLTGGACAKNQNKCNIGRLSHYTTSIGAQPEPELPATEVPEPAGLALTGLGLLMAGVATTRRRRSKH